MIRALLSAPMGFDSKKLESDCDDDDTESYCPSDESSDVENATSDFVTARAKRTSWRNMPHSKRGITLQELLDLYDANQEWLDERQWQCSVCATRSPSLEGPCISARCGSLEGEPKRRNLYEVNAKLIRPMCAEQKVSYVEMLCCADSERRPAPIDTFVSHWWGEEFHTLVLSLKKYAEMQAYSERCWFPVFLCYMIAGIILPIGFRLYHWMDMILPRSTEHVCIWDMTVSVPQLFISESTPLMPCAEDVGGCVFFSILLSFCIYLCAQHSGRNPRDWSFWICAFANNQYALHHAVGAGDVGQSSFATALRARSCRDVVALLDKSGEIYKRAWCAFELFYASIVLPRHFGRQLDIKLINDHGIVSKADCSNDVVDNMAHMIHDVRTADAKASVARDRVMIRAAMEQESVAFEDLDDALRNIAISALRDVGKKNWAPLVVFSLVPILSAAQAIILYHVVVRDVESMFLCIVELLFIFGLFAVATLKFPVRKTATLAIAVPVLFSFGFEAVAYYSCSKAETKHVAASCTYYTYGIAVFSFVVAQSQVLCFCGFTFGCFYMLIRRYGWISRFRRRVDAVFFT
eukprot:TRINITY_DN57740_c0_g1_i1.p1 TRINITY_DN57740_c0_g1~~TRINITY_DN57740_c0_g1_i1.p1  ORF type:complete len:579 (-),score=69.96 TRINITY_DN57740_c0_g1_i1:91-1827(-)